MLFHSVFHTFHRKNDLSVVVLNQKSLRQLPIWRNSSLLNRSHVSFFSVDKENQQGFFTCERNSDYFFSSQINFCILVFLLFLYHSFHHPCYYLKFSIIDFAFIDWLFMTCVLATLAVIGTTLLCGRFGSHVLISKILTFFVCSRLFSDATC